MRAELFHTDGETDRRTERKKDRQTDTQTGHDKANSRFLQFCEHAYKCTIAMQLLKQENSLTH